MPLLLYKGKCMVTRISFKTSQLMLLVLETYLVIFGWDLSISIFNLTQTGNNVLTINMQDWQGKNRRAQYSYFNLQDNSDYYLSIRGFSGDVGDDLYRNDGYKFATFDKPDANLCAENLKAGWWYNYCSYALPNGVYYMNGPYTSSSGFYDGIYWKSWRGYGYSLKFISMTLSHM